MKLTAIMTATALALVPLTARAQDTEEAPAAEELQLKIAPLMEGSAAPFSGLLVPEERFTELLQAELERDSYKAKYEAQKKHTIAVEDLYSEKLKEAAKPPPWYETPSFNRWLGVILGVAVTGFTLWGATEMVKASGDGN